MRKLAFCVAVMLITLGTPGLADLTSRYLVSGRFKDTTYYGAIDFKAAGQVYRAVAASGDGGDKMNGFAIEYANFLAVAETSGDGGGFLAIYKRERDSWTGIYTDYSKGGLGAEVFFNGDRPDLPNLGRAKSAKLAGKYRLSGTRPDGSTYTGEAELTLYGTGFDVARTAGNDGMTGTAMALDNALVWNISNSDDRTPIGVLGLFVPDGNGFLGVWAKAGTDRLGAERWVRQ